jgi:single-strand DNA-binding protein
MIGVEGELRQDRWQQDGQNRSKVEIVANNLQLLGGGAGGSGGSGGSGNWQAGNSGGGNSASWSGAGNPPQSPGPAGQEAPPARSAGDDDFTDDIPF